MLYTITAPSIIHSFKFFCMKIFNVKSLWLPLFFLLALGACREKEVITIPEEFAHFQNRSGDSYFIVTPTTTYNVPVGLTTVSNVDRTVSLSVSSPTGAVQGTHFNIASLSVTIPAGQAVGVVTVQGIQSQYLAGRKDTLVFTINSGSGIVPADYNNSFRLFMRGPCFDGDIGDAELNAMLGAYTRSFDDGFGPYGPYRVTIKSITRLTPTTARAVIENVWDFGFGDVNFIMDWSNPNNTIINVEAPTIVPANAGTLNAAYNGMNLVIRRHANGQNGTFSVCNGTLRLVYQLGVFNPATNALIGYFGNVGVTTLAR